MSFCFFIGHHTAPQRLQEEVTEAVRQVAAQGITHFVVGNYGAFDTMAASAVKQLKKTDSTITLQLLLPYHPAQRPVAVPEGFDGTLYPFEKPVPQRIAILKANQLMIDSAQVLITYVKHPGNAQKLLEYAQRHQGQLTICNLAE